MVLSFLTLPLLLPLLIWYKVKYIPEKTPYMDTFHAVIASKP